MNKTEKNINSLTNDFDEFNIAVEEAIASVITEAVNHFLKAVKKNKPATARYFYKMKELKTFIEEFTAKGGDIEKLKITEERDDLGDFFCYEVGLK